MKTGDYVTGVPVSEDFRKDHPTVTGRLDVTEFEMFGNTETTYQIVVHYDDDTEANIDVEEESIKPASPRRHQETTLE